MRDTIAVSGDRQLLDAVLDAAASLIVVLDPVRLGAVEPSLRAAARIHAEEFAARGSVLDLVPAEERAIVAAALEVLGRRVAGAGRVPLAHTGWRRCG